MVLARHPLSSRCLSRSPRRLPGANCCISRSYPPGSRACPRCARWSPSAYDAVGFMNAIVDWRSARAPGKTIASVAGRASDLLALPLVALHVPLVPLVPLCIHTAMTIRLTVSIIGVVRVVLVSSCPRSGPLRLHTWLRAGWWVRGSTGSRASANGAGHKSATCCQA